MEKEQKQIGVIVPDFIELRYNRPENDVREKVFIDAELVPEIFELWKKGIRTTGCCSGHGNIKQAYIGVIDEDIPKMQKMGYEPHIHPDPTRKDNFIPKTIKKSVLQAFADFIASHPSKEFKVTGGEHCRALVIEKV